MMKWWSGVIAVCFAATTGLAAQEPPKPGAPAQAQAQAKVVTVSGCIQNVPAAQAAGGSDVKFVLSNAKIAGQPGDSAVGTSGRASTYGLDGSDAQISKHLNQQVEVTGEVDSSAAAGASPKLKVSSVKMVAADCQQ